MFNLKISGIAAGAAFVLSFLMGLISRATMPLLLVRPAIFAVLFFIISGLVYHLVSRFLPELLEGGGLDSEILPPGSRVNITEEGAPPPAQAFFGAQADDSDEGLGNIADLVATSSSSRAAGGGTPAGMDQNAQDGYNKNGGLGDFSASEPLSGEGQAPPPGGESSGAFLEQAESTDGFPNSVDILPDLESMAGAFLPPSADEESDTTEYSVSTPARKPPSSSKTPAWAGDFNVKDMAEGLRTILNKEKEG